MKYLTNLFHKLFPQKPPHIKYPELILWEKYDQVYIDGCNTITSVTSQYLNLTYFYIGVDEVYNLILRELYYPDRFYLVSPKFFPKIENKTLLKRKSTNPSVYMKSLDDLREFYKSL